MRYVLIGFIVLMVVGGISYGQSSPLCITGQALGFAAIQKDPVFLVGTIPSVFTSDARYFSRRYNCKRMPAQARRVTQGIYDVRFPGLNPVVVSVTAYSDEGISASAWPLEDSIVRVALRGPLGGSDVATRRDVPFSIVVY